MKVMVKPYRLVGVGVVVLRSDAEVRGMFRITIKCKDALEDVSAEHHELFSTYRCLETMKCGPAIWEPLVDDLVELITILE